MSVESSLFSLANAERYVFRPTFVFVTFLLILLAATQATGRLAMQVLHIFEPQVRTVLAGQNISLLGLRGEWRGFNPIVTVDRVAFPAGELSGVELELDTLESIVRNTWVLRHGSAADVRLALERTAAGWRLKDMPAGDQTFDVTELIEHSDELSAVIQLELHGDVVSTVGADARLINVGGNHFAELSVHSPLSAEPLVARLWRSDDIPGWKEPGMRVEAGGSLVVPEALGELAGMTLNVERIRWSEAARQGGGELRLSVDEIVIPGVDEALALTVGLEGQREEDVVEAMSTELAVSAGDEQFNIGPLYLQGAIPRETSPLEALEAPIEAATELIDPAAPRPMLHAWLAELDLAAVSGFFDRHLGNWEPAGRWVRALALEGTISNVHAYVDPEMGAGYKASFAGLNMQGYKGAPTLDGAQGQLWGAGRSIAAQLNTPDVDVQFPDLFHQSWQMRDLQGVVKAWVGQGYFALRGSHLRARIGESAVAGAFAVTRPDPRYEQRVSLEINVDSVDMDTARTFVPYKIPVELAEWLDYGPQAGQLSDARFAYHGQVHTRPGELGRRIELASGISRGRVRYEPDWPLVGDIEGRVHVAGVDTRISVTGAQTRAVRMNGGDVTLHNNGDYVSASLDADTEFAALLDFVRNSPLQQDLTFIEPDWQGGGPVKLKGDLLVPIKKDRSPDLAVDLAFQMDGVALAMPGYRTELEALRGAGTFSLPHNLKGELTGELFERAAEITVDHDAEWLRFDIAGTATPEDAYELIEFDGEVPVDGEFNFDSVLSLAMAEDLGVTNLSVSSDLVGLEINLPAEFSKLPAAAAPSELDVQFLSDYQSVAFRHKNVQGWLHYGDEIERGALGIDAAPPMTAQDEKAILISGTMPQLVLSEWVSDEGDSAVSLPLDWRIQNLKVGRFVIDELSFDELVLNGYQRGEDVGFAFAAPTLKGDVQLPAIGLMTIDLEYLQLPVTEDDYDVHPGAPEEDPLSVEVGESLPAAKVNVAQLDLGDEPFGAWRFVVQPEENRVVFSDFGADVNGVHIEGSALSWDLESNESAFDGVITLDDLAETLPKWDYAASVSTDTASVTADVVWPGSPANVNLLGTSGDVDFVARDGRFIEVAPGGGVRILSLLNFTKITNRMNFDFSDVVGEGVSFEKVEATVGLDAGQLRFPEPMFVDSSSGSFQVGGSVNLHSGELDNEMIVTLPVSKSFGWYGVYLALANPLAGLGVMVGERVLRKPIEQFSTAKFAVRGTLDDPEVSFVSLWDTSMKEGAEEPAEQDAAAVDISDPELAGEPVLVDPSR